MGSEMSSVTNEQDDAAKIAAAASETGEGINDTEEVIVIEPSPTQVNPSMLPKTMETASLRQLISKLIQAEKKYGNCWLRWTKRWKNWRAWSRKWKKATVMMTILRVSERRWKMI